MDTTPNNPDSASDFEPDSVTKETQYLCGFQALTMCFLYIHIGTRHYIVPHLLVYHPWRVIMKVRELQKILSRFDGDTPISIATPDCSESLMDVTE